MLPQHIISYYTQAMDRNGKYGYREIHHTADVAIEVWSDTLIGIIKAAYDGMTDLIKYHYQNEDSWEIEYQTVDGDFEDQVIAFLNEIIYLLEMGIAVKNVIITEIEKNKYKILMVCSKIESAKLLIKAVTYNGASLTSTGFGFKMRFVFDI